MFRSSSKKQKIINEALSGLNQSLDYLTLVRSLEKNIELIKKLFVDVDVLRIRYIVNEKNQSQKYCILYCDGVVDPTILNESVIKPLMICAVNPPGRALIDSLINQVLQVNEAEKTNSFRQIVEAIVYGDTVLFTNGAAEAIVLGTKNFETRAITEPENERILRGPREGFTELMSINLSMIRRRVRTNELKMKYYSMGKRTNTKICVCYMEGIVNKKILQELYSRLDKIDIDEILDANYIVEIIKDKQLSPFNTTGHTERPDTVVGKLLEGRIAVFVDGTPVVLTLPHLFIEHFQSPEDYYLNYYYTTFSRLIRILGFFLTVSVPGLYIAIVAFHHELIPTQLLINITTERASVPLPAALEAFIMLVIFDILRETGVRMPANIGQALSIVGALVIGQSAVEAKLVAAPMIIVVALTGITNLLVPRMAASVIITRYFLLLVSSMFGFYGFVLGLSVVFIHILNLRSFGVTEISLSGQLQYQDLNDTYIRAPLWQMKKRPKHLSANRKRMKGGAASLD